MCKKPRTCFRLVLMLALICTLMSLLSKLIDQYTFQPVNRSEAMFFKVNCNVYQQSAEGSNIKSTTREAVEQKPAAKGLVTKASDTKLCFMQVNCHGRLGNQLFQYGLIISTANRYGHPSSTPLVARDCLITDHFTVSESSADPHLTNNKVLQEKGAGIYNPMIEALDTRYNWTMDGFFQSWRYLDAPLVKSRLKFKPSVMFVAKLFLQIMTTDNTTTVSIHVRRGDFLTASAQRQGFSIADTSFIERAMNHYRRALNETTIVFVVLSDNIGWCKKNIKGPDVIFSPFSSPGVDLAVMSLCDHVVVTGGTFGWWGGFLCKGSVVYNRNYPTPGSQLGNETNSEDFYPSQWIPLS